MTDAEDPSPTPLRVGVDVGGTFTDLVVASQDGVEVAKVPSTPDDQSVGIVTALARAEVAVDQLTRFVHGTTVATNTVLERDGARTVLVTTAGFGDLLALARQDRPHLYQLDARRSTPLVARDDVIEVEERTEADATVSTPLTDDELSRVLNAVSERAPEAVAVSLLFGYLTGEHEDRLRTALETLEVPVTTANDLLPVLREVERTSTVVANAYLRPRMARYLSGLEDTLGDHGLAVAVEVMRSAGGTATAAVAAREPVHAVLSGPAAGAWGAAALGASSGVHNLIAVDVGGTSTDVSLIRDGRPGTTTDHEVAGLPLAVPTTDIHTIGAGGGSIAWRDDGGALRVGPRSAGADPGPACYDQGGTEPTVTDANVVLGRLAPKVRLGGSLPLAADRATDAVGELARSLGLSVADCARGIVEVTEAAMVQALRVVSVERGHDPRGLALVTFGGAGALHQAALARELGSPEVLVPPHPGVLSALGLLAAPVTVDHARSVLHTEASLDGPALGAIVDELAGSAIDALTGQGVKPERVEPFAELRYRGQAYELAVPFTSDRAELTDRFHGTHRSRYGYALPDEPARVVTLRVRAEGPTPPVPLPRRATGGSAEDATIDRLQVVTSDGEVYAPVIDRDRLGTASTLRGPAVLAGLDATVWVAPWQAGEVDEHGVLHLTEAQG